MVDKVSYFENQNQNYQNNIFLCENHQNKCKTFKLDSKDHSDIFRCHTCMIQETQDYSQTVPLSQVCSYNNSTVILSWPPLEDQTLLQKLLQISQQSHHKQTECEKIRDFFDSFITQITSKINDQKKSILSQSEYIIDSRQEIQHVYQQIASLQDLKEIIQDDNMNITKKSQSISNIILKKNSEKSQNTQLINECLKAQNIPQIFDISVFNQFKSTLISQIELLDYQNQSLVRDFNQFTQQFLTIKNSFNISNQTMNNFEIQNETNLDRIIKLISNKSNSCSKKYLDSVKQELNKLSTVINSLNIEREEVFIPNQQQISIDFNHLENNQVESIQILTEKMSLLNQQYNQICNQSSQNVLNQYLQPSSLFVMENLLKAQKFITQQKMRKIENLLRIYPIFEVEQIIKPMKYDYQIELSNFQKTQTNTKVIYENNGYQSLEIIGPDNRSNSYIRVNQFNQYRIRIKMELKRYVKQFFIGLVKDRDKDDSYGDDTSKICCFSPENYGYSGVSKIIKGQCLSDVKYGVEYNEIEVRFCVKDKLFQVCDYPKRQNINTINDDKLSLMDPNSTYHLGLYLYYKGDKISILEFEEEKIAE